MRGTKEGDEPSRGLPLRADAARTLAENIPGAAYRCACDKDWTVEYVSRGIEDLSGYPPSDFIGNAVRSYASIIHPEDVVHVEEGVFAAARRREPYLLEYRILHKDGSVRWVLERGRAIFRDGDDHPAWLDGVILDDSLRRAVEEQLQFEKSAERGFFEENIVAALVVDEQGVIRMANRSLCALFGYDEGTLEGQALDALVPSRHRERHRGQVTSFFAKPSSRQMGQGRILAGLHRDGTLIPIEVALFPVHFAGRTMVGASIIDIRPRLALDDARARAERALGRSEERLREAQRIAHLGSWELDVETGRVTWTEELYAILGLDASQPPPDYADHERRFTPESWARLSSALDRARAEGVPFELELEFLRPDGGRGWVQVRGEAVQSVEGVVRRLRGVALDITARKRAESDLQLAYDIVRNIEVGIYIYHLETRDDDRTLRMIYANPASEALTGVAVEDAVGRTLDENFPGLRALDIPQRYAEVVRTGEPRSFEDVQYGDDRVPKSAFAVKAFPLPGACVGVSFENVTERRIAEDALRQSELRFQELAEQSRTWVWEVDARGIYTFASPVCERLFGYRPEDLVGKMHFYDLHPEEGREEFRAAALAVFERKEPFSDLVNPVRARNGSIVHVLTNGIPLLDAAGRLRGYRGTDTDITDRRRTEVKLRQLSRAVEQSTSTIVITDREGRIEYANPAFERTTGYTVAEALGQNPRILKSGNVDPAVYEELWKHLGAGLEWRGEFQNLRKDGSLYWEQAVISPVRDEGGRITHYIAVKEDITERKRVEDEQRFKAAFLQIAAETSTALASIMTPSDFDDAVNRLLSRIGTLFAADRAYLFLFTDDLRFMTNSHEWCADGVSSQRERMVHVPTSEFSWWMERIRRREGIQIPDVTQMPPEAELLRSELVAQGVRSLLCLPTLGRGGSMTGFLGFDMTRCRHEWPEDRVLMLQIVADSIGETIARRKAEDELRRSEERWGFALEGSGEGVWDWNIPANTSYWSPRWKTMLGYGENELTGERGEWVGLLYPDDRESALAELKRHLRRRRRSTSMSTVCSAGMGPTSGSSGGARSSSEISRIGRSA